MRPSVNVVKQEASEFRHELDHLHTFDRWPRAKFCGDSLAFIGCSALAIAAWRSGLFLATPVFWMLGAHFAHANLLAFHDASHGMLHPVRWMNNLVGHIVGTVLAIPLSVYRYAHAQHHAHLASENDPELWPFVKPGTPRWKRLLAAALAIAFGTIYSPFLFLRAVLVAPRLSKRLARKIAAEYAGSMLLWSVVLAVVWRWHWWELFAVGVAAPIMLAGTYQTLRLYTEHMGLMGDSPLSSTRTVAATRGPGRLLSLSMWHVDHHGAHHVDARIPNYHLPEATRILCDAGDPRGPIYESYLSAFVAMLPTLGDPKIGRQWIEADP